MFLIASSQAMSSSWGVMGKTIFMYTKCQPHCNWWNASFGIFIINPFENIFKKYIIFQNKVKLNRISYMSFVFIQKKKKKEMQA